MKILIIRSGALGDVLMTTALVRAVRKKHPKARIEYLTGKWSAPVLSGNKDLNEVITFPDEVVFERKWIDLFLLALRLRNKKYDLGLVLDKAWQWNFFAWTCGIKKRIGFDRHGEGKINTASIPFHGEKNEIEYYLDIARELGIEKPSPQTHLHVSKKDIAFAKKRLRKGDWICIAPGGARNPGAEMAQKRWSPRRYAELIDRLSPKYKIVLIGGPDDCEAAVLIKNRCKANFLDLIGETDLRQSAAVIKQSKVFVTHDSGPMHLGYAVGAKMVVLFGPTPAERFAPPGATVVKAKTKPSYDVYGNYDEKDLMGEITVDEVYSKVLSQLKDLS